VLVAGQLAGLGAAVAGALVPAGVPGRLLGCDRRADQQ
jgi:NADP-dependent 3-hydroxy acid dehydrogenase YdfG